MLLLLLLGQLLTTTTTKTLKTESHTLAKVLAFQVTDISIPYNVLFLIDLEISSSLIKLILLRYLTNLYFKASYITVCLII